MTLFNLRTFALLLIVTCIVNVARAQDSVKRTTVVKTSAAAPAKPIAYKKKYTATPVTPVTQPAGTTPAAITPVQPAPAAPADKSLWGQYAYLQTKVYNYQRPLVAALYKNYMDTLNATRRQLKEAKVTLTAQTKTIDALKTSVTTKDQTLSESQSKVNEVSFLGMPMAKGTYNLIMWGLVVVFGAVAGVVLARSGAHSREAAYRVKLYDELEEEYKGFKAKAKEKEMKLARELQTERNKVDELTGKA